MLDSRTCEEALNLTPQPESNRMMTWATFLLSCVCSISMGVPGLEFIFGAMPKTEDLQMWVEFWETYFGLPGQLRGEVSIRTLKIYHVNCFFFFVGACQFAGSIAMIGNGPCPCWHKAVGDVANVLLIIVCGLAFQMHNDFDMPLFPPIGTAAMLTLRLVMSIGLGGEKTKATKAN